jgi:hypothetical protein
LREIEGQWVIIAQRNRLEINEKRHKEDSEGVCRELPKQQELQKLAALATAEAGKAGSRRKLNEPKTRRVKTTSD